MMMMNYDVLCALPNPLYKYNVMYVTYVCYLGTSRQSIKKKFFQVVKFRTIHKIGSYHASVDSMRLFVGTPW